MNILIFCRNAVIGRGICREVQAHGNTADLVWELPLLRERLQYGGLDAVLADADAISDQEALVDALATAPADVRVIIQTADIDALPLHRLGRSRVLIRPGQLKFALRDLQEGVGA